MTDFYSLLWDNASGDQERIAKQSAFAHSKVAVAHLWPFLARAVDEADFENRLSLILSRVEASVDAEVLPEVLSSFREDFRAVTAASDNPFAKDDDDDSDDDDSDSDKDDDKDESDSDDEDSDSDDDDSDKKSDSDDDDDDSDDDDKPAFLKGKESAKKKEAWPDCQTCGKPSTTLVSSNRHSSNPGDHYFCGDHADDAFAVSKQSSLKTAAPLALAAGGEAAAGGAAAGGGAGLMRALPLAGNLFGGGGDQKQE